MYTLGMDELEKKKTKRRVHAPGIFGKNLAFQWNSVYNIFGYEEEMALYSDKKRKQATFDFAEEYGMKKGRNV